jgi:hypothetical protein
MEKTTIARLSAAASTELRRRTLRRVCDRPSCLICLQPPTVWVVSQRHYDEIRMEIDTIRPGSFDIDPISFNLRLWGIPVVATNNEPKVARLTGGHWLS